MIRNIRAFGLALVAICALGAIAAQAASAAEFHSEKQNTVITGESEPGEPGNQVFRPITAGNANINCHKASFAGTNTAEGGSGSNWTSKSITVHPIYSECEGPNGPNTVTVNTAGCHYKLFAETTAGNPTGGEHANAELLGCTNGGITITDNPTGIVILVKNQLIEHAVRYTSTGSGSTRDVTVAATAHGIEWECTAKKATCVVAFGASSGTDASYVGNVVTKGFTDPEAQGTSETNTLNEGAQVGIWKE